MFIDVVKVFIPTALAFFLGIAITPIATHFFYKYRMWKRYSRNDSIKESDFQKIHNEKEELKTPRVGGIIIWLSAVLITEIFYFATFFLDSEIVTKMNFLSRNQTYIPFFALLLGALIGFWDDLIQIFGKGKFAHDDSTRASNGNYELLNSVTWKNCGRKMIYFHKALH